MTDFGELVLICGDLHLPHRCRSIPDKFLKMLVPNKMQHVFCTGNLTEKIQYERLKSLAPNVYVTRGEFDTMTMFPEQKVISIGQFQFGMMHGHQIVPWGDINAISAVQRKLNVDMMITGHTHECSIEEMDGKWIINPGSITGAFNNLSSCVIPSFILMAIQGDKAVAYIYELKEDTVVVSKKELTKS